VAVSAGVALWLGGALGGNTPPRVPAVVRPASVQPLTSRLGGWCAGDLVAVQ